MRFPFYFRAGQGLLSCNKSITTAVFKDMYPTPTPIVGHKYLLAFFIAFCLCLPFTAAAQQGGEGAADEEGQEVNDTLAGPPQFFLHGCASGFGNRYYSTLSACFGMEAIIKQRLELKYNAVLPLSAPKAYKAGFDKSNMEWFRMNELAAVWRFGRSALATGGGYSRFGLRLSLHRMVIPQFMGPEDGYRGNRITDQKRNLDFDTEPVSRLSLTSYTANALGAGLEYVRHRERGAGKQGWKEMEYYADALRAHYLYLEDALLEDGSKMYINAATPVQPLGFRLGDLRTASLGHIYWHAGLEGGYLPGPRLSPMHNLYLMARLGLSIGVRV